MEAADWEFYTKASDLLGICPKIFGLFVGMQAKGRSMIKKPKLRGARGAEKLLVEGILKGAARRAAELSAPNNMGTTAPVAISQKLTMAKPQYRVRNGKIVIDHCEYVADLAGSVAFAATSYAINPGAAGVFPWLANVANNYQRYKFRKLRFYYVPLVGSSTNGRVSLAWNGNVVDPVPVNKSDLFAFTPNDEEACWTEVVIDIPTRELNKVLYTRQFQTTQSGTNIGVVGIGTDLKTTDVGRLLLGTTGMGGTSTVGEVYVCYEVELEEPKKLPVQGGELQSTSSTISNAYPIGSTLLGSGLLGDSSVTNTFTLGASGRYMFSYAITGTVITSGCTFSVVANGVGTVTAQGANQFISNAASTLGAGWTIYDVVVDPASQICTVLQTFNATTLTKSTLIVSLLPPAVAFVG